MKNKRVPMNIKEGKKSIKKSYYAFQIEDNFFYTVRIRRSSKDNKKKERKKMHADTREIERESKCSMNWSRISMENNQKKRSTYRTSNLVDAFSYLFRIFKNNNQFKNERF